MNFYKTTAASAAGIRDKVDFQDSCLAAQYTHLVVHGRPDYIKVLDGRSSYHKKITINFSGCYNLLE